MLRALLAVSLAVATFAAVAVALQPAERRGEPPARADERLESSKPASAPPPKLIESAPAGASTDIADLRLVGAPRQAAGRAVRDVTPPGVTRGPAAAGPLVRIDSPTQPKLPPQARTERLYNPLITAAGVIKAGGRDIRLGAITATDYEARCGEGLQAWPCGRMARAALRRFIRGRAIECEVPAGAEEIPDPAECHVAGKSLSEWLVAQGWAKRDGDAYAALERQARDQKLGLWGERPGGHPDEVAAGTP